MGCRGRVPVHGQIVAVLGHVTGHILRVTANVNGQVNGRTMRSFTSPSRWTVT